MAILIVEITFDIVTILRLATLGLPQCHVPAITADGSMNPRLDQEWDGPRGLGRKGCVRSVNMSETLLPRGCNGINKLRVRDDHGVFHSNEHRPLGAMEPSELNRRAGTAKYIIYTADALI